MNQTKHRKHRHNGAEDRQGRARPKDAPDAEDRSAIGEQNGHARTPQRGVPTHPPVRSVAVWGPIAAVIVLAFLVTIGVWRRVHERGQEKAFTKQTTQLEVNVVTAQRDRKTKKLIMPGTFQAFQETTIYPRANGYVKSWKVDIGDNVVAGQLLAEIETPEVDQQLAQAKANYDIAKVTADRWRDLVEKKVVSTQENDEKQKAAEAARANLEQLQKTQGFKEIVAPFGGSISARNIDVGTLATANAFLFRTEGPQVAIHVNENRIHWQNIQVGRDFGTNLEVLDGLTENTKVVISPTDDLHEGIQVQVKPTEKPKG